MLDVYGPTIFQFSDCLWRHRPSLSAHQDASWVSLWLEAFFYRLMSIVGGRCEQRGQREYRRTGSTGVWTFLAVSPTSSKAKSVIPTCVMVYEVEGYYYSSRCLLLFVFGLDGGMHFIYVCMKKRKAGFGHIARLTTMYLRMYVWISCVFAGGIE